MGLEKLFGMESGKGKEMVKEVRLVNVDSVKFPDEVITEHVVVMQAEHTDIEGSEDMESVSMSLYFSGCMDDMELMTQGMIREYIDSLMSPLKGRQMPMFAVMVEIQSLLEYIQKQVVEAVDKHYPDK